MLTGPAFQNHGARGQVLGLGELAHGDQCQLEKALAQ